MALGQIEQPKRRIYLSIHHGKVEASDNGAKSYFSYVEGGLLSIYSKERTYGTEKVLKWFMDMMDEEGELYTISFPYNSGTFKSIVLAMASAQNLNGSTIFKIEPYQKGNFTNVVVYADGVKLDWVTNELPPVEDVRVGSQTYKDDSKRMNYICSLVDKINISITQ
jgi:hypothetical protein